MLVQSVIERRCFNDVVVYPLAYLYSHSLELRLKDLLYNTSKLLGCPELMCKNHNLLCLWKKVRRNLSEIWGEGRVSWGSLKEENDAIHKRLEELVQIKEGFRYPDVENRPSEFNLRHLKNVMGAIHIALDNSSTEIHERGDYWRCVVKNRRSEKCDLDMG